MLTESCADGITAQLGKAGVQLGILPFKLSLVYVNSCPPHPTPTGNRTCAHLPCTLPGRLLSWGSFHSASGQAGTHHPHLHLRGTNWLQHQDQLTSSVLTQPVLVFGSAVTGPEVPRSWDSYSIQVSSLASLKRSCPCPTQSQALVCFSLRCLSPH